MPIAPPSSPNLLGGVQTPSVSGWYSTSMVSQVPEEAVAFMLAQGYEITNIQRVPISNEDGTDIVGERVEYSMTRTSLNNGAVVGSLISSLSSAFQQGRAVNEVRYQNIVSGMSDVLASYQADTKAVADSAQVDGQFVVAINDLDALTADAPSLAEWTASLETLNDKLDAYDVDVAALIASYDFDEGAINSAITESFTKLTQALATYRGEVATMKNRQAVIEASIKSILVKETGDLIGHQSEINAALDALDDQYTTQLNAANAALADMESAITNFSTASGNIIDAMEAEQNSHEGTLNGLLAEVATAYDGTETQLKALLTLLVSDYNTHAATATAFLTGLGATETARINEQFDNAKAKSNQLLVSRGLYSSAIVTQMEAQVERERSEALTTLNDRLNREKWENQHRLYEQQQVMRGQHIGVYQQLAGLEQQAIQFRVGGTEQLNVRAQEIRRISLTSRQETERVRMELFRLKVGVSETYSRIFTDIKSQIVSGLSQLQQARLAVSRGQADDYQKIFGQIAETFVRSLTGEDRFASLDAQLRGQQQSALVQIEQLGQSWSQTQAGLLETGVAQRGNSANIDAQVRSAYYDVLVRQKTAASDSRVRVAMAKGDLLTRHIDEASRIAVSLYGFMERREDPYPGVGSMAQTAASLAQPGTAAWRG